MNHRAHLQYKLQQTVEAISSIAIFAVFSKSIAAANQQINAAILTGLVAPFIIAIVVWSIHRVRRKSEINMANRY